MTKKVLEPNVRTADSLPISTPTCLILFVDSSPNCLVLHYELILVSSSPILGVGQGLSENRLPKNSYSIMMFSKLLVYMWLVKILRQIAGMYGCSSPKLL